MSHRIHRFLLLSLVFVATAAPLAAQYKAGEIWIFRRQRFAETTCSGATASFAVLCADSTGHKLQLSNNNGAFANLMTDATGSIPDSALSSNVGLLNRNAQNWTGSYNQFSSVGIGGAANGTDALTVVSTTLNHWVGQYDSTHKMFAYQSSTSGYFGTMTPNSLVLRTNNADAVTIDTSHNTTLAGTLTERNRSTPMGEWVSPAYNSSNFTATGLMTWTVDSGDISTYAYTLVGKTLTVAFVIDSSSVGGTLSTTLNVKIPGGYTSAKYVYAIGRASDNGTAAASLCRTVPASSYIDFFKDTAGAANWSASTNNTSAACLITFEIQ